MFSLRNKVNIFELSLLPLLSGVLCNASIPKPLYIFSLPKMQPYSYDSGTYNMLTKNVCVDFFETTGPNTDVIAILHTRSI